MKILVLGCIKVWLITLAGLGAALAWSASGQTVLQGVEDLQQARIGVLQGSAHDQFLQKNMPQAKLFQFLSVSDLVLAVDAGQVDAGMMDEDTLSILRQDKPQLVRFGASQFTAEVGAGFHRDSGALRAQFNAFLAQIKANGVLEDMHRRWVKERRQDMPIITIERRGPPLKVALSMVGLPSVALVNAEMVGLEVELARRFGAYLGREPEWQSLTWTALISTLAAKKADVIISSMYITEERKQRIDFSDPYYTNGNFFFIHAKRGGSASDAAPQAHIESPWFERIKSSFYSNLVREERYLLIWNGLKVTVELSILSALLGTLLGAVLCAMRMSQRPAWSWPARLYIALLRGTPVLVLLMIIFYVVFASVNVEPVMIAVVAFAMNFGAYSAEIFRVGIESVDRGQTEGGVSMGFTPWATFVHIVLPQTVQRVLPVFKGEFISLVKMTSIVGYVAVEDLTKASDIIRSRTFDAFFPLVLVGVLYFLISWVLIQALEYLERRTDPMQRRVRKAM